eukprot:4410090-Prymnesium_polylepis.1
MGAPPLPRSNIGLRPRCHAATPAAHACPPPPTPPPPGLRPPRHFFRVAPSPLAGGRAVEQQHGPRVRQECRVLRPQRRHARRARRRGGRTHGSGSARRHRRGRGDCTAVGGIDARAGGGAHSVHRRGHRHRRRARCRDRGQRRRAVDARRQRGAARGGQRHRAPTAAPPLPRPRCRGPAAAASPRRGLR